MQQTKLVPCWSCSQAVSRFVWHIPLLCVQWNTPDDGQRNCPKHVEFYSKNKFEKLVHLVGFIVRFITVHGHLNVKFSRKVNKRWRAVSFVYGKSANITGYMLCQWDVLPRFKCKLHNWANCLGHFRNCRKKKKKFWFWVNIHRLSQRRQELFLLSRPCDPFEESWSFITSIVTNKCIYRYVDLLYYTQRGLYGVDLWRMNCIERENN